LESALGTIGTRFVRVDEENGVCRGSEMPEKGLIGDLMTE